MKPLDFGDRPSRHQTVYVVGYPQDADKISVTKAVVSRVELTKYSHSEAELMTIQINEGHEAINCENIGGPIVMENTVVGVAFQHLLFSKNIVYIIPTPIIKHFITNVEKKENVQIRSHFKMSPTMTGIRIKKVNTLSSAYHILNKDDILLSIDGVSIGNDETVEFWNNERINYNHLVSMKKPGEATLLEVLREGKQHEFNINIKPVEPLIPLYQYDKLPSYYILAGFVFVPLTKPYVLADDINKGYASFEDLQVKKVNGVQVENLKHLYQGCVTEDLRLDLEKENDIVLQYKAAIEATPKIIKR